MHTIMFEIMSCNCKHAFDNFVDTFATLFVVT